MTHKQKQEKPKYFHVLMHKTAAASVSHAKQHSTPQTDYFTTSIAQKSDILFKRKHDSHVTDQISKEKKIERANFTLENNQGPIQECHAISRLQICMTIPTSTLICDCLSTF